MSNMSLCRLKSLPGYGRSRLPKTSPGRLRWRSRGGEHEEPGLLLDAKLSPEGRDYARPIGRTRTRNAGSSNPSLAVCGEQISCPDCAHSPPCLERRLATCIVGGGPPSLSLSLNGCDSSSDATASHPRSRCSSVIGTSMRSAYGRERSPHGWRCVVGDCSMSSNAKRVRCAS